MLQRRFLAIFIGLVGLTAVACSGAASAPTPQPDGTTPVPFQPTTAPTISSTSQPSPTPPPAQESATATPRPVTKGVREEPPLGLSRGWKTDFSKHSVPFDEIRSGGPPRDGIPPIDNPAFELVSEAPEYLEDDEPVVSLELDGEAKAYPLAILMWHEIVNDELSSIPVTVTYCPLCNTAIVFDRRLNGEVFDFGTSGLLRNSDLVMWDRQTESWWQQITGEAIVGELTGTKLTFMPANLISWGDFRDIYPEGQVLTRETGHFRDYDSPPYRGYDTIGSRPFLFSGQIDDRLDAMERVVGLTIDDQNIAYPFMLLEENPVINETVGEQDLVVFYTGGTLSAFAGRGGPRRVVGSTGVYEPFVEGQKLTFTIQDDLIVDEETGSKWNILGQAVEGLLEGSQLPGIVHANHFWFAWAAFHPDTLVKSADDLNAS